MIYLKITEPSGFLTTMVPLLCTIIVLQQYSTTLSPFSAHSHIPSWFDMVLVGPRVTSVEAKLCRKKNLKERRKPPFLLLPDDNDDQAFGTKKCRKGEEGIYSFQFAKTHPLQITVDTNLSQCPPSLSFFSGQFWTKLW